MPFGINGEESVEGIAQHEKAMVPMLAHQHVPSLRSLLSFLFAAIALSAPEICALAVDVPAKPAHYFNDYASLIDPQTAQQLDQRLEDFASDLKSDSCGNLPKLACRHGDRGFRPGRIPRMETRATRPE
jgi:hypothetical protein